MDEGPYRILLLGNTPCLYDSNCLSHTAIHKLRHTSLIPGRGAFGFPQADLTN